MSRYVSSVGLVVGSVLGLAGTFHFSRQGKEVVAAGFLVFVAGESLILSTAAMDPATSGPVFGAGAGLWAGSLALLSAPNRSAA
jgi:hypothetical protein